MKASTADRMHFKMMSLVHETLYGLFKDPHKALNAAGINPGQKVLEAGCGPGFFTIPAAKMVGPKGSVCALDMSPSAIERVRQKIEKAGVTNVETVLADAARTGLPDESFDLIFLFGLDHAKGDMRGIMAEMHRPLNPGEYLPSKAGFRSRSSSSSVWRAREGSLNLERMDDERRMTKDQ